MDPQELVISALRDRGLPQKRDEITAAFADRTNSARYAKWVLEHVNPNTLLSQEELGLYEKLKDSETLPALYSDANFDSTRPFLDEDLRKAIIALNTSTAEIKKQTDILASQYESLQRQHKRDKNRVSKQNREVERVRRKHEAERQSTAAAVSELAHELEVSLKNESEKSTVDGKKILSALAARLKDNDRLLSDLEDLASGVKSSDGDISIMKRTTELSSVLSQYVAEEIYYRLDRLYLEKVLNSDNSSSGDATDKDSRAVVGLEQEMDSLYPEIDILAEMSIKQQFVEPILRQLQIHHGKLRIASHQKLDLILEIITDMTVSTENLIASLQGHESVCATIDALASTYRSEVGDHILDSTSSRRETMRRFSSQATPVTTQPGKHSGPFLQSEYLNELLRRLGLSIEAVFQASEAVGAVQTMITERQHMLDGLHKYGIASDSPLVAEMALTDWATNFLTSALEADSLFTASLSSVQHERMLLELESKLSRIQKGIERVNYDVVYQRDKNQEKFLEMWG
ncbi:hypothetical protein BDW66DRAFT_126682 [Aspergillus desertorum]